MDIQTSTIGRGIPRTRSVAGFVLAALALLGNVGSAHAQAGAPLPRCTVSENAFYLLRFAEGNPGTNALIKVGVSGSGAGLTASQTTVWTGQTPSTVAAGMRPQDGYIYGIRAVSGDTADAPARWQDDFRAFQVIRYGTTGAQNLGVIDATSFAMAAGTPPHSVFDPSPNPNFNAADIDPKTGYLVVGMLRTGNYGRSGGTVQQMKTLLHIDVTATPPKLVKVTDLSVPVLLSTSGDFAIDATGTYAYGVSYQAPVRSGLTLTAPAISYFWRADLNSGAVTQTVANLPTSANVLGLLGAPQAGDQPYGGGALLSGGNSYAFYANQTPAGVAFNTTAEGRLLNIGADGTVLGFAAMSPGSNSADATRCLPKLTATLACTPTNLVDAAGNVSNCTVTLDQPAPAGGLNVALVPPLINPRYTTSCGASVTVAAGATTAQCTITATPNLVPGDGFVDATVALAAPAATADYELGTPNAATVRVDNDDLPSVRLSCVPPELTDSPGQVATCTIESNVPAPAGGMTVALTPPTGNPRYTTTCGTSVVLAAGASSATCTITATPNIVPGDGDVPATLTLTPPVAGAGYQLGAPDQATVLVRNDDAPLPVANLVCVPPTLTDSPGQVSTCTVTLNSPAPAGGLSLNLTPPAAGNPRYSSTCASPLVVAAGASSASCTITATPNTVTGDGSVVATVQLLPGTGYTVGTAQAQAQVTVNDDDLAPVPGLGWWGLLLVSLGLVAVAWRRQDRLA